MAMPDAVAVEEDVAPPPPDASAAKLAVTPTAGDYGSIQVNTASQLIDFTVSNTGARQVLETVQAYISDLVTSVTWAKKELKAWQQVTVPPGDSVRVQLAIPAAACTLVDAEGRRIVEPGAFDLLVGHSSRAADLLRARFTLSKP